MPLLITLQTSSICEFKTYCRYTVKEGGLPSIKITKAILALFLGIVVLYMMSEQEARKNG